MRNFLAFIRRFQVLLIFALLQGVALTLYFSFMQFPRSQYLTTASSVTGSLMEVRNDITKHFSLSKSNDSLQSENIRLMEEANAMSFISLSNGLVKINDTLHRQQYEYIAATVINSTFDKANNYFTLNIGEAQGIEAGMGVFSGNGVVGVIHNTSEHYSVVKSVLTEAINIDIMLEKTGQFGLLKWNNRDARRGTMWGVSNDLDVKQWASVVTRGGGGIFPSGIPVGNVESTEVVEGESLWDVTILFSEDYRSLQRVYIVKNLLKQEQEDLESLIPIEPVQ
ncbi:MAG: rod shape-determining protein MreC [Crocinitomicaceae bacterium]|nr:rod shape-determining protein MreC [Crocinitomicaceae bacterium]